MADLRQQLLAYQVTVKKPDLNTPITPEIETALTTLFAGVQKLSAVLGGMPAFLSRLKGLNVFIQSMRYNGVGRAHSLELNQNGFDTWTVVHELAHAWDGVDGWNHSREMKREVGAGYRDFIASILHVFRPDNPAYWYLPGGSPPPCGIDRNFTGKEDFAEAVTAYVFPDIAKQRANERGWPYIDPIRGYAYTRFADTPRGLFVKKLIERG